MTLLEVIISNNDRLAMFESSVRGAVSIVYLLERFKEYFWSENV